MPRRARRSTARPPFTKWSPTTEGSHCDAWLTESSTLVGAWLPDAWETTDPSGNKFCPLGRNARGVIIYTDNGYLSVNIINPDRIDDIPAGLSLSAMATGECSFFAYSGPYAVGDGTVEHHIDLCTVQERIGTVQKRLYSVSGNRLVIRSETALAAAEMVRNKLE